MRSRERENKGLVRVKRAKGDPGALTANEQGGSGAGRAEVGRAAGMPLSSPFPPVSDGPTQLRALNLTDGSALLHWKPPQKPVDEYNVQVASPGGEHG